MALLGWYGLFGGTVLVGVGFEVSRIQNRPSVSLLMTVNPDVEFTDTSLATCLPAYFNVSYHDENEQNI